VASESILPWSIKESACAIWISLWALCFIAFDLVHRASTWVGELVVANPDHSANFEAHCYEQSNERL